MMKHLTHREEEIMELFWSNGAMFVKDLISLLSDPKPHYNTISTIVRGLEDKGFLKHKQYGNTYQYGPRISRDEFSRNSIKNLISKYFNASYASVISMFVEEQKISTDQIKELIKEVESHKNKKDE